MLVEVVVVLVVVIAAYSDSDVEVVVDAVVDVTCSCAVDGVELDGGDAWVDRVIGLRSEMKGLFLLGLGGLMALSSCAVGSKLACFRLSMWHV